MGVTNAVDQIMHNLKDFVRTRYFLYKEFDTMYFKRVLEII